MRISQCNDEILNAEPHCAKANAKHNKNFCFWSFLAYFSRSELKSQVSPVNPGFKQKLLEDLVLGPNSISDWCFGLCQQSLLFNRPTGRAEHLGPVTVWKKFSWRISSLKPKMEDKVSKTNDVKPSKKVKNQKCWRIPDLLIFVLEENSTRGGHIWREDIFAFHVVPQNKSKVKIYKSQKEVRLRRLQVLMWPLFTISTYERGKH